MKLISIKGVLFFAAISCVAQVWSMQRQTAAQAKDAFVLGYVQNQFNKPIRLIIAGDFIEGGKGVDTMIQPGASFFVDKKVKAGQGPDNPGKVWVLLRVPKHVWPLMGDEEYNLHYDYSTGRTTMEKYGAFEEGMKTIWAADHGERFNIVIWPDGTPALYVGKQVSTKIG